MLATWDVEDISDPNFKAKFIDLPKYIEDWASEIGGLSGKS